MIWDFEHYLPYPGEHGICSPEQVIRLLDEAGISKAIVMGDAPKRVYNPQLEPTSYDWTYKVLSPDNVVGIAKRIERFRDRLIGCAWINPRIGKAAAEELETCVKDWNFKALKLMPIIDKFNIDNEEDGTELAAPLFKKAEELGIIVIIHTGAEIGCDPLQVGVVAEQFPEVPIIMDHSGYGPGKNRHYAAIRVARKNGNVHLGTTRVKAKWIRFLVDGAGADRVIFGSNGPEAMGMGDTPAWWVDNLKKAGLTEDEFELVAWKNLARTLRMDAS